MNSKYDTASLLFLKSRIMRLLNIQDRRYHLRQYKKCFVCNELIDSMVRYKIVKTREDGVVLGVALQKQLKLWRHVLDDHDFSDNYLFFRLSTDFEEEEEQHQKQKQKKKMDRDSSSVTTATYYSDSFIYEDEDDDDVASLDEDP